MIKKETQWNKDFKIKIYYLKWLLNALLNAKNSLIILVIPKLLSPLVSETISLQDSDLLIINLVLIGKKED